MDDAEDGALDLDGAIDLDCAIDFDDAKDGALEIDDAKDGGLKFDDALDFDETDVTTLVLMVAGVGALKFFVDWCLLSNMEIVLHGVFDSDEDEDDITDND